ncbi:MAG: N-acetylmuramoyl-L-alanine amidase [Paludibacteraceae bacterium]|nr:N-acetylmuramoyl-L-alanine amidase [Paludibacteraceae bacterium]
MRLKVGFAIVMLALFAGVLCAAEVPVQRDKPFVVVIDAGHGGTDPGAVGKIAQEKDLNLSVSLLTGKMIKDKYPEVEVLYTRETDVFIPLQKRADFVNKNNANLFICVHTNSSPVPAAKGAETFVLGTEKLDRNLDVAMRENAVIKLESDYQTKYHGFDPNSIDSYIMFELMQNQYLDQSLNYASLLQQQFAGTLKRGDRGVRQAAFWVLLKSACPSVLVEMGFISNPEEEKFMASEKGQTDIAASICTAFGSFYKKVTGLKVDTVQPIEPAQPVAQPTTPSQPSTPIQPSTPSQLSTPSQHSAPSPTISPDQPRYAVQIFASHELLDSDDDRFLDLEQCGFMRVGDWYKYYYGVTNSREEAIRIQQKLKDKFPGCFVIKLEAK